MESEERARVAKSLYLFKYGAAWIPNTGCNLEMEQCRVATDNLLALLKRKEPAAVNVLAQDLMRRIYNAVTEERKEDQRHEGGEVVAWLTICPACKTRMGYLMYPAVTVCGCPLNPKLEVRSLTYADTPPAAERDSRAIRVDDLAAAQEVARAIEPHYALMQNKGDHLTRLAQEMRRAADEEEGHGNDPQAATLYDFVDRLDAILACTEDGASAATETANVPCKAQEAEK